MCMSAPITGLVVMTFFSEIFIIQLGPYLCLEPNHMTSFCRKDRLSLSHLVPEIIGSKVGIAFYQYQQKLSFDNVLKQYV